MWTGTRGQAAAQPTWSMGQMNTLNSATLVNKGLELIEASLLFSIPAERIDVTVHKQSIIHSMVTFVDGATLAQASPPSMKLPISLALDWPNRVPEAQPALDFTQSFSWDFEPVDDATFPAVQCARGVGGGRERGGGGRGGRVPLWADCFAADHGCCGRGAGACRWVCWCTLNGRGCVGI